MTRYFVKGYDGIYFQTDNNPSGIPPEKLLERLASSLSTPIMEEESVEFKMGRLGRLSDMRKLQKPGDWIVYLES